MSSKWGKALSLAINRRSQQEDKALKTAVVQFWLLLPVSHCSPFAVLETEPKALYTLDKHRKTAIPASLFFFYSLLF